jgi:hypothetical protein
MKKKSHALEDIVAFETEAAGWMKLTKFAMDAASLLSDEDSGIEDELQGKAQEQAAGMDKMLSGFTVVLKQTNKKGKHVRSVRLMPMEYKGRDRWQRVCLAVEASGIPIVEKFEG